MQRGAEATPLNLEPQHLGQGPASSANVMKEHFHPDPNPILVTQPQVHPTQSISPGVAKGGKEGGVCGLGGKWVCQIQEGLQEEVPLKMGFSFSALLALGPDDLWGDVLYIAGS